ncbi:MAG: ArsA-related P-loop ATPase [Microthrixaceae bacterium]
MARTRKTDSQAATSRPASSSAVAPEAQSLDELVSGSSVIVCSGSGGVGKTTTAAVLAMRAAMKGRRAVVVTIDPAKRLADALGLAGLTNEPAMVDGVWSGELWAMMLDTKATFDGLVTRHARTEEQARTILDNGFYQNISSSLSGTQEYMASEKLYELAVESDYDLVVVDTPPTRNALDFLEAPQTLARFLDHRLYRVLVMPTKGIVKAVNLAAQTVMRSMAKVVGAEVIADAMEFFAAFEGMDVGFKERAQHVDALLRRTETAFVLIASPRADTVAEATFFATELHRLDISVRSLIVNRMSPVFDPTGRCEALLADSHLFDESMSGDSDLGHYRGACVSRTSLREVSGSIWWVSPIGCRQRLSLACPSSPSRCPTSSP